MEYNIIFQRIFHDIPFIGYYRLEDIPYSSVICNIISYFFLRSAYSPRRTSTHAQGTDLGGSSRATKGQEALWPPVLKARRRHKRQHLHRCRRKCQRRRRRRCHTGSFS